MGRTNKILNVILSGRSDKGINFNDLITLVIDLGFTMRIKGDHHIFTKSGVDEIINLQPVGAKAKPYQVKQVRDLILKYRLGADQNDQI